MPTTTDGEAKGCTFQWKIENLCHRWWEKKGEGIESPVFIADALGKTKWTLWLYPMEEENENNIAIYLQREEDCSGPDIIEASYQFAFLGKDGSILKEKTTWRKKFSKDDNWGFAAFEGRERVFVTEREAFLPEDTLTVQCTLWITNPKPDKSNHLFATTVIKVKRRYFVWRIDKRSNRESDVRSKFRDYLIRCNLFLLKNLDQLCIHLSGLDDSIRYISCNVSIIDSEERRENCGIQKYFVDDLRKAPLQFILANFSKKWKENKGRYFPNDVLSLDFEFVLLTIEHSDCRENSVKLENEVFGNAKSQNTAVLTDDLYSLYNDGMFSDMELRTSTKTFHVHQNILSARSCVSSMFQSDREEVDTLNPDFDDDS
ncbi:hypothetical protein AVEN_245570-1 [Araneus ventricosus]|uniref:MATH domain-containing protein n=1 Tax=Araneus ventricosus TaxID=182803 RepID=A0A4Y2QFR6_ARAVE|nr:hypothetical protein AVEN_245570-1 [Araneus ventricosus]